MDTAALKWQKRIIVVIAALCINGNVLAQSTRLSDTESIISEELMARLVRRTLAANIVVTISSEICAIFAICDGTSNMSVKQITRIEPEGKYYLVVPLKEGSKDIIVAFKNPSGDVVDSYLTDKSGKLRAAATSGLNNVGLRLITNEQAAEKFKAVMRLLAKLAEKLPPSSEASK